MRTILLLLSLLIIGLNVKAQDVIIMKDGDDLHAKVLEVTTNEIKYERKGKISEMKKSDAVMIRYKDGKKQYFNERLEAEEELREKNKVVKIDTILNLSDSAMSARGTMDAKKYYRKYKSAESWTTTITFLTSPFIGLFPAIAFTVTPPKDKNLNCPNPALLNVPAYGDAYRAKARKMKTGKTWLGYGMGSAICIAVAIFVSSLTK